MKRMFVLALALSGLISGCSSDSNGDGYQQPPAANVPTGPTTGGSTTSATSYAVTLLPSNENPPISNAESSMRGAAAITITATKDGAGNVTSATATFEISATAVPAGTSINIAHIHPGVSGVDGPILVNTGLSSGELAVVNGAGSVTKTGVNVKAADAQAILKDPASYYFNIHTTANPNGALRGQLSGGSTGDGGTPTPPGTDYP